MAKVWPPASTISALMMASVMGSVMVNVDHSGEP
jgi:hypothetical protein